MKQLTTSTLLASCLYILTASASPATYSPTSCAYPLATGYLPAKEPCKNKEQPIFALQLFDCYSPLHGQYVKVQTTPNGSDTFQAHPWFTSPGGLSAKQQPTIFHLNGQALEIDSSSPLDGTGNGEAMLGMQLNIQARYIGPDTKGLPLLDFSAPGKPGLPFDDSQLQCLLRGDGTGHLICTATELGPQGLRLSFGSAGNVLDSDKKGTGIALLLGQQQAWVDNGFCTTRTACGIFPVRAIRACGGFPGVLGG